MRNFSAFDVTKRRKPHSEHMIANEDEYSVLAADYVECLQHVALTKTSKCLRKCVVDIKESEHNLLTLHVVLKQISLYDENYTKLSYYMVLFYTLLR